MSILDNLPHRCACYSRVRTRDELGGSTDAYVLVFQDRPCWQQQASDSEVRLFDKRGILITNRIYFTSNPRVNATHRLVIDSVSYDVVSKAVPDASAGLGVVWRVMVSASTNEGTSL